MLKTGFRPSDDPNDLAYNIPGNAMFATYLDLVAKTVLETIPYTSVLYGEASILKQKMIRTATMIRKAIFDYGVVEKSGRKVLAYEVSGKG